MIVTVGGKPLSGFESKAISHIHPNSKPKKPKIIIRDAVITIVDHHTAPPTKQNKKEESATIKRNINNMFIKNKHKSFLVTPNTAVKNDKVELFIDSFANNHKEMYQQISQFKFGKSGIYIPEQDKVFWETHIKKEHFKNYITTNEDNGEYVNQQIGFTWNCNTEKSEGVDFSNIHSDNAIAYEFRFKYTSGLSLRVDGRTDEKPLREFLELSRMMRKDEQAIIQFGFQASELDWWKEAESKVKELPKRKNVSEKSKLKLGFNGYDCCLRLIVVCDEESRRIQLSRGFIMALKQLNADQELVGVKVKQKKFDKWLEQKVIERKIPSYLKFNKRMIMTWKEMLNFMKLPQKNLQVDFNLDSVERVEFDIPKSLQTKTGIMIGQSEIKGRKYDIRIPVKNLDDLMKSYVYTGSPRMGKDSAIINKIVEGSKKGIGAFIPDVIDEKGNDRGMSDSIRDALPPDKVIDINLGDYFNPVYFGLEDVAAKIGVNGMNVIADNFIKVLGLENTTNAQELCSMVAKACKCNLNKMYYFLKSRRFAQSIYEELLQEDELLAMEVKYEYLNNKKADQDAGAKALKTRLKTILGNPQFKHMMSQEPNNSISFERWITEGKVVIMRMKKLDIGDIGVQVLMYLLSMKVFWLKKIMNTNDCTYIVYNEPHQYMSDGLQELMESMLVESPKYRLSLLIAFHNYHHLPNRLWEIMKSSSINWFLFKNTNLSFYRQIAEQLDPITIEMAMKTKQYESIFLPFIGGEQLTPFFMKMLPPPKMRQKMYDNSYLTKEHSKVYGRPVQEVRKNILAIEKSMYEEDDDKKKKKAQ